MSKPTPPPRPVPTSLLHTSREQDDLFWKGFRKSAAAHAAFVIVAVLGTLIFSRAPVKVIPSIRVDLVGLPDMKKSDLNKPTPNDDFSDLNSKLDKASKNAKKALEEVKKAPPPESKSAPQEQSEPDDAMALKRENPAEKGEPKSRKKDLQSALERIKALADLEGDDKRAQKSRKVQIKGNQVSKGNASSGPVSQGELDAFFAGLQSKVRDNWNLPVWLSKQNLNAAVTIFLDRGGYVTNMVMAKSSGNKQFDDYCLKTIRMSQPFPNPPSEVTEEGITLGFPL